MPPSYYARPTRPAPPPPPSQAAPPKRVVAPSPPSKPAAVSARQPEARPAAKRKKRSGKKFFIVLVFLILLGLCGGGAWLGYKKYVQKPSLPTDKVTPAANVAETKPTGTIRLIATGDNLAFDSINTAAKQPDGSYNYLPLMSEFKPFFEKADIRLCNETTPAGGDKNGLAISGYPTFNAPLAWSIGFAELGCNVINLASEHANDKGQPAIDAMVDTWSSQSNILAVAGANKSADEQSKIRYFSVKGVKFAYLAYTVSVANKSVSAFGVNVYSDDLAAQQITEAHKHADLVIVSMNWGTENTVDITADQDRIAQSLANQNVDVIIGGGPHVLQPAKVLNGKEKHQTLVWFSLGNFLNSELPVDNLIGGMAVMDFDAATQQIQNPKLLPLYMHYEWTSQQKAAGTINARHDFKLYPLDQAAEALARSQNGTTVQAQTDRVTAIITKFIPIQVIKTADF